MLVWENKNRVVTIEFVQVKHENRSSRWSVAALTEREKKKVIRNGKPISEPNEESSILEKSLKNSRCCEETCFRIVTSIDVDAELQILKLQRDDEDRRAGNTKMTSLVASIVNKLGQLSSDDGTTIALWTERCFWDKRPDSNESIGHQNRFRLEIVAKRLNHRLYPDHRDELYQSLLALVSTAAVSKFEAASGDKRILQAGMRTWINSKLRKLNDSGPSAKTLQTQMKAAGIPSDVIESAEELRVAYLTKRLDRDYIKNVVFKEAEEEVTSVLQHELSKLDAGEWADTGIQFHSRCLSGLKLLSEKPQFIKNSITFAFLQGYMYERTSRGVHRFTRPRP